MEQPFHVEGCRALIAAVLDQAFSDAISLKPAFGYVAARRFIDETNRLFCDYCYLLDLDPQYVARKMQQRIRRADLKPLKEFRD